MGAGLLLRIATAFRAVTVTPMPAGYDIALLADVADVADRQSRDGRPQRVIGSEDAVIPVPVFPRLWNEIREPMAALCLGITERMRVMRPSPPRITESRSG
jgi:hypothetical protein